VRLVLQHGERFEVSKCNLKHSLLNGWQLWTQRAYFQSQGSYGLCCLQNCVHYYPTDHKQSANYNTLAIASDCSALPRINHYMREGSNRIGYTTRRTGKNTSATASFVIFVVTLHMTGRCFATDFVER
jgi:hypothetical protein